MSDQLTDGRRFRILVVVDDDCTRECLALVADASLSGPRVVPADARPVGPAQDRVGGQFRAVAADDRVRTPAQAHQRVQLPRHAQALGEDATEELE